MVANLCKYIGAHRPKPQYNGSSASAITMVVAD